MSLPLSYSQSNNGNKPQLRNPYQAAMAAVLAESFNSSHSFAQRMRQSMNPSITHPTSPYNFSNYSHATSHLSTSGSGGKRKATTPQKIPQHDDKYRSMINSGAPNLYLFHRDGEMRPSPFPMMPFVPSTLISSILQRASEVCLSLK